MRAVRLVKKLKLSRRTRWRLKREFKKTGKHFFRTVGKFAGGALGEVAARGLEKGLEKGLVSAGNAVGKALGGSGRMLRLK